LLTVAETVLLKVEALAEGGGVVVDDCYKFVAKTFLKSAFCDAEFEVSSGVVKIADKVESARKFSFLFRWMPSESVSGTYSHGSRVPGWSTVYRVILSKFGPRLAAVLKVFQYGARSF
jgi:hypothetical protein